MSRVISFILASNKVVYCVVIMYYIIRLFVLKLCGNGFYIIWLIIVHIVCVCFFLLCGNNVL